MERRRNERGGRLAQGEGPQPGVAHRRLGAREHPRRDLGRVKARETFATSGPRDQGAVLRPVRARAKRRPTREPRRDRATRRACPWAARSTGGRGAPELHRLGQEGAGRREPRPDPDRQGLGRRRRVSRRTRSFDVVWSGDRKPGKDGKVAGGREHRGPEDGHLHQRHRQPRADRAAGPIRRSTRKARVYYVRVLQIPTPRWSTYDAVAPDCRCSRACPPRSRSARGPRPSGTRPRSEHDEIVQPTPSHDPGFDPGGSRRHGARGNRAVSPPTHSSLRPHSRRAISCPRRC